MKYSFVLNYEVRTDWAKFGEPEVADGITVMKMRDKLVGITNTGLRLCSPRVM